jgi:hypothetical protein
LAPTANGMPDSAAELLLDGASLAATSNSEKPRKLLAPRLWYCIAEAEGCLRLKQLPFADGEQEQEDHHRP